MSSDILQVSCRGFFYGAHKAITGLPQPWQIHLTDANVFRKVRTNGDGACALHAAFGNFLLAGELAAPSACRKAVGALLLQLSRDYAAGAAALGERLATVASMLWSFAMAYLARKPDRDTEADLFWQHLDSSSRDAAETVFRAHVLAARQHAQQLCCFDAAAARLCTLLPRAFFLEPIAMTLDGSLAAWQEPAWELGPDGNLIVKTTRTVPVGFPADRPPDSKLAALGDARSCFDCLRRAFFLRGRGASSSAQQDVVRLLYEIAEQTPSFRAELLNFVGLLLDDFHHEHVVATAPDFFGAVAFRALAQAVQDPSYWFSVDELLLFADLLHQNVIVLEEFPASFQCAGFSTLRSEQAVAFVSLESGRIGCVRSHFSRVLPFSPSVRVASSAESVSSVSLLRRRRP